MKTQKFTLIELLIASGICALVLMALFSVMTVSSALQLETVETNYANNQVRSMIARLRAAEFEYVYNDFKDLTVTDVEGLKGKNPKGVFKFIINENANYYHEGYTTTEEDNNEVSTQVISKLGLPLDLNGNGTVGVNTDDADIITSSTNPAYLLLPAVVRVSWDTPQGRTKVEVPVILCDR